MSVIVVVLELVESEKSSLVKILVTVVVVEKLVVLEFVVEKVEVS